MFHIQNLVYQYQQKNVLEIPNWQTQQGEKWLLLGKSGSGKSTLLHILAGFLANQQGKITIQQQDIDKLNNSEKDKFRAKNIGFIFQKPHFISSLTILQNLLLAQYSANIPQNLQKCIDILETLGLQEHIYKFPHQISQGQAQRVAVARALLNNPVLLLADEPTASVDDDNAQAIAQLLQQQAQNHNATLVIATHDQRIKTNFELKYELESR